MLHRRTHRSVVVAASFVALWIFASGGCAGTTTETEPSGDTIPASSSSQGGSGGTATGGMGTGADPGPCGTDCSLINTPQCQVAQCNVQTGQCEVVNDEEGVACDDGMFCTISDSCSMGTCVGGAQNDCGMAPPQCTEVTCDEMSQTCASAPAQDGASCQDPNDLCLKGSTCSNGQCIGGSQEDCFFFPVPSDCHIAECNTTNGMCEAIPGNQGQSCNDLMDLCTINKTCDNMGTCQGGNPVDCTYLTQGCDLGACDTMTGMCGATSVMNGQGCDDLNGCTSGEICTNQVCGGGTAITACEMNGDGCCPNNCTANNDLDCNIQPSCKDVKMTIPASQDGLYTIDPDGNGPDQPFQVYCDMTHDGGGWTQCLSVLNTNAEDLHCTNDVDYFDNCVDFTMASWSGSEVMVKLMQGTSTQYAAHGTRPNPWTYELLTSTSVPNCPSGTNAQYNRSNQHTNTITLDNTQFLTISGKGSGQQGWGGSWGNGYQIVVQTTPSYASNNVVTVMPLNNSGCYNNCQARSFVGMNATHEVMYGSGGTVTTSSNSALTTQDAFLGEFKFLVR
jgi:hypothetical protein